MQKNVASQKWIVFAFNRTDNTPKTGDAANITGNLRLDGGAANAIDDTNPTELEDGYYVFDITQAESNADLILNTPVSGTSDIQVIGVPGTETTTAPNFNALGIESDGDLTKCNLVATTTANSDMRGTNGVDTSTMRGTDSVDTSAMRGTDSAALASVCTEVRLATLTDWINDGRLDTILDLIAADVVNLDGAAMRGTDSASTHSAADVWTAATRVLTAATNFNDLSSAQVQTAAAAALVAIHLDHLLGVDYDPSSKPGVATALFNELIENNAGVSRYTEASLAQAPSGSGGDATEAKQDTIIANQVNIKGAGFVEATDSQEAIRNRGDAAWVTGVGGVAGAGADSVTITVNNSDTNGVVADADTWITSDSVGALVVAGTLQTDSAGKVTFSLDAGVTYYLWVQKDGIISIRGESFVAVAD